MLVYSLVSFYIQLYIISNCSCNVLATKILAFLPLPNILFSGIAIACLHICKDHRGQARHPTSSLVTPASLQVLEGKHSLVVFILKRYIHLLAGGEQVDNRRLAAGCAICVCLFSVYTCVCVYLRDPVQEVWVTPPHRH